MGRWTDLAPWMGPTRNEGDGDGIAGEAADRMYEVRGLVLHIAQGTWAGIVPWAQNPNARVSMHFAAGRAGQRAQVVDTDIRAWTQADGNGRWLSVENEGFVPDALTAQQVEFAAQIFARGHQVYGYPLQLAESPGGYGLGYHAMGGAAWGGHYDCPGLAIIAQRGAVLARAVQLVNGEDEMLTPEEHAMLQELLNRTRATDNRVREGILNGSPTMDDVPGEGPNRPVQLVRKVDQILAALADPVPVEVDAAAVAAAIVADPAFKKAIADQVRAELDKTRLHG